MLESPHGSVYLTDLEHNGVVRWNAASKKSEAVITDKRLLWPDTLSWDRTAICTLQHHRSRTCRGSMTANRLAPNRTNSGKLLASKNPINRSE